MPNALKRESRTSRSVKRIAHIVPQLVDGGHAPTRLYRTLFAHHDRSKYEIDLLVTEEFIFRTSQYPFPRFVSASSQKRGPQALQEIQQGGANTWIAPHALDFDSLAALIGHELKRRNVDVAVFHGATPVNLLAARCARTSCLALFDHGLLPVNGGFDLYLSANQEEASRSFDGAVKILPHVVDIRANWPLDPPSLGRFGVPADSLGLTTISFHLEDRLSTPMCEAAAEILYRVPTAYYLPIGPVTESAKHRILAPFHKRGASKRLRFLDRQENPSHLARAMTLYLNEFPIGSGVALLDAMAAGLPIVSMYDENGAHQARYAANAFGKDRTVHSLNPSDYVDLAVQLLQDAAKRREWSNHALRQYDSRGTASEYVSKFEQILEAWWKRE